MKILGKYVIDVKMDDINRGRTFLEKNIPDVCRKRFNESGMTICANKSGVMAIVDLKKSVYGGKWVYECRGGSKEICEYIATEYSDLYGRQKKYMDKQDRFSIYAPPGTKMRILCSGETLNAYINKAIEDKLERDGL